VGDLKLNAPMPFMELRAETTKAKRADVLPLRADIVELLKSHRGDAGDEDRICRTMPSMASHKRYLEWAKIPYEDDRGRRVDFHSLRHTYGSMLSKVGVAPRVAMSLMRHSDMRLTMNVYSDPRIFDMNGAVEKLPAMAAMTEPAMIATGTEGIAVASMKTFGVTKSVTTTSAASGVCSAVIGKAGATEVSALTLAGGSDRHEKTPSGLDRVLKRAKGVEPSTFGLESRHSAN